MTSSLNGKSQRQLHDKGRNVSAKLRHAMEANLEIHEVKMSDLDEVFLFYFPLAYLVAVSAKIPLLQTLPNMRSLLPEDGNSTRHETKGIVCFVNRGFAGLIMIYHRKPSVSPLCIMRVSKLSLPL